MRDVRCEGCDLRLAKLWRTDTFISAQDAPNLSHHAGEFKLGVPGIGTSDDDGSTLAGSATKVGASSAPPAALSAFGWSQTAINLTRQILIHHQRSIQIPRPASTISPRASPHSCRVNLVVVWSGAGDWFHLPVHDLGEGLRVTRPFEL